MLGLAFTFLGHQRLRTAILADLERLAESAGALALGRPLTPPRDFVLDEFASAGATLMDLSEQIWSEPARARVPVAPRRYHLCYVKQRHT